MKNSIGVGISLAVLALAGCKGQGSTNNAAGWQANQAAAGSAQAPVPGLAEARAFVERIYTPYTRGESPNVDEFYTAELRAAVNRFDGQHEGLGYDPFCQCQDVGGFSYDIQDVRPTSRGAEALVVTTNLGENVTVLLHLARENGQWRVANIGQGEDMLYKPETNQAR